MNRIIILTLIFMALSHSVVAVSPEPDARTAGSDVAGKFLPSRGSTTMVGIPAARKKIMEGHLKQFSAIVLRHPALKPPVGFDFRTGTHAYAPPHPASPHAPLACTMTGLFYWYTYMPAYRRIQPLSVALHGFFVRANDISTVFNNLERWPGDEQGLTYLEPWEIRKVAGFPQYSTGAIVLKRSPKPIWVPVSRGWAIQRALEQARKNMEAVIDSSESAQASDRRDALKKWLGERPERQREMEKSYAEMKKSNPEYAEKIRANFFTVEKRVEGVMRDMAERQKNSTPDKKKLRLETEQSEADKCVRSLEEELARLSPADHAAPAYISLEAYDRKQPSPNAGCSRIVDAGYPGAIRLVKENPDYYDPSLPPTALQVIIVDFSNFERSVRVDPPWRHAVYERIRDNLDYAALAATLQE